MTRSICRKPNGVRNSTREIRGVQKSRGRVEIKRRRRRYLSSLRYYAKSRLILHARVRKARRSMKGTSLKHARSKRCLETFYRTPGAMRAEKFYRRFGRTAHGELHYKEIPHREATRPWGKGSPPVRRL